MGFLQVFRAPFGWHRQVHDLHYCQVESGITNARNSLLLLCESSTYELQQLQWVRQQVLNTCAAKALTWASVGVIVVNAQRLIITGAARAHLPQPFVYRGRRSCWEETATKLYLRYARRIWQSARTHTRNCLAIRCVMTQRMPHRVCCAFGCMSSLGKTNT